MRVNHQHETNNLASNSGLFGCALSAQNCAPISPEKNAKLQLPEQAWLTSLNYQQETLELEGLARTFDALLTLETSLRHYVSFPLNRTGATRQDAQGRWQFHYQLTRSAARERAL